MSTGNDDFEVVGIRMQSGFNSGVTDPDVEPQPYRHAFGGLAFGGDGGGSSTQCFTAHTRTDDRKGFRALRWRMGRVEGFRVRCGLKTSSAA